MATCQSGIVPQAGRRMATSGHGCCFMALGESLGGWDDVRYQSSERDYKLLELELLNLNPKPLESALCCKKMT